MLHLRQRATYRPYAAKKDGYSPSVDFRRKMW
jgi:hypothetical protein